MKIMNQWSGHVAALTQDLRLMLPALDSRPQLPALDSDSLTRNTPRAFLAIRSIRSASFRLILPWNQLKPGHPSCNCCKRHKTS